MSAKGLHIVHAGVFSFWFERGEFLEKEYFTYGLATQEGKYNLLLQYPNLENKYGSKKSKINTNKYKIHQIVEIDTKKIDIDNDASYKELVNDRNRLYRRFFLRNFCAISAVVLTLVFLIVVL
jgi:hypothetical protein